VQPEAVRAFGEAAGEPNTLDFVFVIGYAAHAVLSNASTGSTRVVIPLVVIVLANFRPVVY
jgi:hypothetical protein